VLAHEENVYEVLRQKELEVPRLKQEVEALRVAAPLLSEDEKAEKDNKPTLQPAVNDPAVGGDRAKRNWP
jgi:hypothetical protein